MAPRFNGQCGRVLFAVNAVLAVAVITFVLAEDCKQEDPNTVSRRSNISCISIRCSALITCSSEANDSFEDPACVFENSSSTINGPSSSRPIPESDTQRVFSSSDTQNGFSSETEHEADHVVQLFASMGKDILKAVNPEEKRKKFEVAKQSSAELADLLLTKLESSQSKSVNTRANLMKNLLYYFESTGPIIATSLMTGEVQTSRVENMDVIYAKAAIGSSSMSLQFTDDTFDISPSRSLMLKEHTAENNTISFCSVLVKNTRNLVSEIYRKERPELDKTVNSNVMMISLLLGTSSVDLVEMSENVSIILKMHQTNGLSDPLCVSFRTKDMRPTSLGCSSTQFNATHVLCSCNHMTSFAVLMSVSRDENNMKTNILSGLVSRIFLIMSISFLTLAFLTFVCFRRLRSETVIVHANLAASLGLAQILFVLGIERVSNREVCAAIAGFLHFLFLCAFSWMGVEGLQIYLKLIKVFEAKASLLPLFFAIGYGIPTFVVSISAGINYQGYGTNTTCWLTKVGWFHLSFIGPVVGIIIWNSCMLFLALVILRKHLKSRYKEAKGKQTWKQVKGAFSLMALLGVSWVFGLINSDSEWSQTFEYIFIVLNGLQGVFIYIYQCAINEQVQKEYRRMLRTSPLVPECCKNQMLRFMPGSDSRTDAYSNKTAMSSIPAVNTSFTPLKTPLVARSDFTKEDVDLTSFTFISRDVVIPDEVPENSPDIWMGEELPKSQTGGKLITTDNLAPESKEKMTPNRKFMTIEVQIQEFSETDARDAGIYLGEEVRPASSQKTQQPIPEISRTYINDSAPQSVSMGNTSNDKGSDEKSDQSDSDNDELDKPVNDGNTSALSLAAAFFKLAN